MRRALINYDIGATNTCIYSWFQHLILRCNNGILHAGYNSVLRNTWFSLQV